MEPETIGRRFDRQKVREFITDVRLFRKMEQGTARDEVRAQLQKKWNVAPDTTRWPTGTPYQARRRFDGIVHTFPAGPMLPEEFWLCALHSLARGKIHASKIGKQCRYGPAYKRLITTEMNETKEVIRYDRTKTYLFEVNTLDDVYALAPDFFGKFIDTRPVPTEAEIEEEQKQYVKAGVRA